MRAGKGGKGIAEAGGRGVVPKSAESGPRNLSKGLGGPGGGEGGEGRGKGEGGGGRGESCDSQEPGPLDPLQGPPSRVRDSESGRSRWRYMCTCTVAMCRVARQFLRELRVSAMGALLAAFAMRVTRKL